MNCSFCLSCGIDAPHDHYLRDKFTGQTCCPKLLATQCRNCNVFGHTPIYCPELQEQRRNIRIQASNQRKLVYQTKKTLEKEKQNLNEKSMLTGRFQMLMCSESDSDDDDNQYNNYLKTKIWADYDDDILPPVDVIFKKVWG